MVSESKINEAVVLLKEAANPLKIIIFGSYARGDATVLSDIDFLVIEREVLDSRAEMVNLRRVLRVLRIPVDVIVVSESYADDWSKIPGTAIYNAFKEGKVVYEAG